MAEAREGSAAMSTSTPNRTSPMSGVRRPERLARRGRRAVGGYVPGRRRRPHRGSLEDAWRGYLNAQLPRQAVETVLLLPWVLALAARHTGWALWLRSVGVIGLAWTSLYMFFPWRPR
jgi:hypothetical protein